jgi:hypothetical protein
MNCKNYIRTHNLKLRNVNAEQRQSLLHLRNDRGHIGRQWRPDRLPRSEIARVLVGGGCMGGLVGT